jgi:hypothetical protein
VRMVASISSSVAPWSVAFFNVSGSILISIF